MITQAGSMTTRSKSSKVSKMISMGRLRRGGVPSISEGGVPMDHTALAMPALDENQATVNNNAASGAAAPPTLVLPTTDEIVPHIDATATSLQLPEDTVTPAPAPAPAATAPGLFNYVSSLLHIPGSAQRRTQACLAAATGTTSGMPAGGVITEEGIAFGTTSEGGAQATLVKHELRLSLPGTGAAVPRHLGRKKEHDSGDEGPSAKNERGAGASVTYIDSPRTLEHRHLLVSPKPTHSPSNPLAGDPVAFTSESSFTAPATRRTSAAGRAAAGGGGGVTSLVIPPNMVGPHYPMVPSPGFNTYREDGEGGFAIGSPVLRGGDVPGARPQQAKQLGHRPPSQGGAGPLPVGSPILSGLVPMSPGRHGPGQWNTLGN
jgi:hypothetical protein